MIDAALAANRETPLSIIDESALEGLSDAQKQQLAEILESYLDDLEAGRAVDREALLGSHSELAHVIKRYLGSINALYQAGASASSRGADSDTPLAALHNESLQATQLGDYEIKHEIGRGGMGIVYAAHQISLGRDVALKVLPFAAVLDQTQVTRFKNEAQAAAGLHHPNIVPVYAVGCERGVHYFSMQRIEGQSLDQAIDQLRSADPSRCTSDVSNDQTPSGTTAIGFSTQKSIRTREYSRSVARLGYQAASAIHHAHEHGIVHRDVKPSNLMVDAGGKLWVTDFGLARASSDSKLTATGDLLGTIRYMSPEQASGRMHEVDHRSDIYSIGITLYELLTLKPAFGDDTRQGVLRAVEHDEPIAPRQLNPSIPVDLETIILKAIEKSRDVRYCSSGELAEDLDRFLSDRPPIAKRPGVQDRILRWASRHRTAVLAGAGAACILFAVVSVATLMIWAEQRRTANAADRAALHLRETQRVVDNFGALVDQRLAHLPSTGPLRGELLGELKKYYTGFIKQAGNDSLFAADVATAQFRLAAVHQRMGHHQLALDEYRLALAGFESLRAQSPDDPLLLADVALCHNNLGQMASYQGDTHAARECYEEAIRLYQSLAMTDHEKAESNLGRVQMNLGLLLSAEGDATAESLLRNAHQTLTAVHHRSPDDWGILGQLALCENNLASALLKSDVTAAEKMLRESIAHYQRLTLHRPTSPNYRANQALAIGNLAAILAHAGKNAEARELLDEAVAARRVLVELEPTTVSHLRDLAIAHNQLGQMLMSSEEYEAARAAYSQSADWFSKSLEVSPDDPLGQSRLGLVLSNLGIVEKRLGQHELALQHFQRAIEHQQLACDLSPGTERYQHLLMSHRKELDATNAHARQLTHVEPDNTGGD